MIKKLNSILYILAINFIFGFTKVFAQGCTGLDEPTCERTSGCVWTETGCVRDCTNISDKSVCETTTGCMWTEAGCVRGSEYALADFIQNIYFKYALPIGGVIAVGMLVYAGIKYTTSSGNPDKIAEAKEIFVSSIIGLIVLLLAGLILSLINPNY